VATLSENTAERWGACWSILGRAAQAGCVDVAYPSVRNLYRMVKEKKVKGVEITDAQLRPFVNVLCAK
jgi:lipoprotein-anchoring transpeptidase ErfK/SrfK